VDAFYFSKKFKQVIHCEHDLELSEIAAHNFTQFKVDIKTISGNGLAFLQQENQQFDWIYIDPSRRSDAKGKVFKLTDCIPNVPDKLDILFNYTENIMIKASPLLDIASAIEELSHVNEIHVVALENEVKELLFILEKGDSNSIQIKTINLKKENSHYFNSSYQVHSLATFSEPLTYLYEPNSAILKAGLFNEVSSQLRIHKLHNNSHLYTSELLVDFPGRSFKIKHICLYNKKQLTQLIPTKKANITVRNFPESVAHIRKKTGIKEGGETYIFCTTTILDKPIVLICEKV
ncbi:MAG: class I SAM-dependent methyltransferase, partial [Flavobacteriaceae bacterium]|nr:class I SAM-dependent methyltransferase [Flavobacteriaceae bacterium]